MKPIQYPLFLGVVLLTAVFLLYYNWGWWHGDTGADRLFFIVMPLVLGALVTFVLCLGAMGLAAMLDSWVASHCRQRWEENWRGELVAMRNADGVKGSIRGGLFLLSGQVASRQVYHYYYRTGKAFKPDSWTIDENVYVYEEDRADGEVIQSHRVFVRESVNWFASPSDGHRMEFHIPKGSLRQSFTLE